jgi:putative NADH-flavin reductase
MKIVVIGATGYIGSAVAAEAEARGHEVTPVARSERDGIVRADALDPAAISTVVSGHDAVVLATRGEVAQAVRVLLDVLPKAGVPRLVVAGGGGSLEVAPGLRFVDDPDFPDAYLPEALAQMAALDVLRAEGGVLDWAYASPPPLYLVDGGRTGSYRMQAGDAPVAGRDTRITVHDYASALVDVLESGAFARERFTVGY